MRVISIDLSADSPISPRVFGGQAGEHNHTELRVKLPNRLLTDDITYYCFEFETVLGQHIDSLNIYKDNFIDENIISIKLWEQLLPSKGDLQFCVSAIQIAADGNISIKGKTPTVSLQIKGSPDGEVFEYNPNLSPDELQAMINEAVKIQVDQSYSKNSARAQNSNSKQN